MDYHAPLFSSASQDESLLTMSALNAVLAPILVQLNLRFVGDDEAAGVRAHSIVYVDGEVSHLTCQVKVLRKGHIHGSCLSSD